MPRSSSMFEFEWWYLAILIPLPLLLLLLNKQKQPLGTSLTLPFFRVLDNSHILARSNFSLELNTLLLGLAWLALLLAAMKPVWIDEGIKLPIKARDIVLAVDLSNSMKERDFVLNGVPSNRLSVVKGAAQLFIKARKHDRLGLIVFGTQAFLYAPLTFDKSLLLQYLNEVQINMAGKDTAIGDAIVLAIKHFIDNKKQSEEVRTLILLTDGQNTAGAVKPEVATELAKGENIKIYTIGMGRRSFFGRSFDEASLKHIANATDGLYFHADNTQSLYKIYEDINRLEQKKVEDKIYRPKQDLFYYPLSVFLLLLVLLLVRKSL